MSIIKSMYCLYDKVAGYFLAPSLYDSDELVCRELSFLLTQDAKLRANASDYELIRVGTFDTGLGNLLPTDHVRVCVLSDLVKE